jgi:hypothetical protein
MLRRRARSPPTHTPPRGSATYFFAQHRGRRGAVGLWPVWNARRSSLNSGGPWPSPKLAQERVLGIQRKLHKWSTDDQDRGFDDLHNLVCDPATLMVAWLRIRANRGSRSAGVDGQTAHYIEQVLGVQRFLEGLREELRSGSFRPLPVKERLIPQTRRNEAVPSPRGACPPRPRGSGRSEAGAGADLRGRLSALFVWVPARTPLPGRDRRDSLPHLPLLRVGCRG